MNSPPTKSLIVPAPGKHPTFDNVTDIVLLSVLCDLSVCVMCLTQQGLERWTCWQEKQQVSITLDVVDINQAVLADWEAFLSSHAYDMIVLAGAQAELQADQISVGYVTALIETVPAGMIMVA